MAYQAIYRKWRPQVFEDIIGQGHITKTLKNQIMSDRVSHAYLFCGTRGTGKTTAAKVLAKAVNCLHPIDGSPCNECEICRGINDGSILDVTEIDAASNNSVDNIREIRDDVNYVATQTKYRVYIIDEVHMLSTGAFNALLKTLEEPPSHVIFILATTEVHKIPETILSRCQRFDFKRITPSDIIIRMKEIATADGINITEDAYNTLATLADGSMRDGLSILERCVSACGNTITLDGITEVLGMTETNLLFGLADSVINNDSQSAISYIDTVSREGKDLNVFCDNLIKHFRDLLICKLSTNPEKSLEYSDDLLVKLKSQSGRTTYEKLSNATTVLTKAKADAKWVKNPRIIYELSLIKLTRPELDTSSEALLDRLSAVEEKAKNGIVVKEANQDNSVDASEDTDPKKKVEVSSRLFAPIDVSSLTTASPIVVTARNWDNIVQSICSNVKYVAGFLLGRKITIDGEGILILFDEKEAALKKLTANYLPQIQEAFTKKTKTDFIVKVAFLKDVQDVLIDYWNLPHGNVSEEVIESPKLQKVRDMNDPLDRISSDFSEIVKLEDDESETDHTSSQTHQAELFENDTQDQYSDNNEEFLEENELNTDSDDVI